ncbi:hypothetical protein GCM10007389_34470 [Pontibacter akesuensis]|nr:hypothetical protein GCM10007389_34470 [Pontibacter akesuensis]
MQKLPAASAVEVRQVKENPLFLEEEVLHLKLSMDMKTVLKDRGDDRVYHPATIWYKDSTGTRVAQALKVKVRGNRRRDPSVCGFPPLMLNFSRSTVENTVFGKVNKLKLVTHCTGEEYVLREYLAYKMYNILTDSSFRVRLCQVTYEDVQGKKKSETKYAFLVEDEDALAERLNATVLPDELVVGMRGTHLPSTAVLTFFQYMIGNTDWSVPYRHNIKVLNINAFAIPVPYDFDYAGCVSAPYAAPPPELEISSVKERLFRGYSYPDTVYAQVRNLFNLRKAALYGLYQNADLLEEKSSKSTLKYLDEFYTTLNNAKKFERSFVEAGQRNERGGVAVKGLD